MNSSDDIMKSDGNPLVAPTFNNNTNPDGKYPALFEHSIGSPRPMKVIVIGAGFSGVYMGIRIPQRLKNVELCIYEKNAGIGGTWWENSYPGCACDIPGESPQ
jgi:hypothetical protein